MSTLFNFVFVAALVVFGLPPQVKRVTHTYSTTEVDLWYPTFININGTVKFGSHLLVKPDEATNWSYDYLRATSLICTKTACSSLGNPVFVAWNDNEQKITNVSAEKEAFRVAIQKARTQLDSMEKYLSDNSCSEVVSGPRKPTFACTDSEAEEVATTTCVIRELGAKACEKMGKDAIDIDAPKFFKDAIVREGCGAAVHEITGENYSLLDKTINKYTSGLATTIVSEFFGLFSKDAKDAFDWTIAVAKTQACIPSGMRLCKAKYVAWQAATTEHFARFDQAIRYCQQAVDMRNTAKTSVESNEGHLAAAEALLGQLKTQKADLERRVDQVEVPHILQTL